MADAQSWKGAAFHYSAAVSDLCGQFFTEAAEAGTGALQPSGTGEKAHRHHAFLGNLGLYLVSVWAGIILGFVLNKLMFLLLLRMSRLPVDVAFRFSMDAVIETLRYFAAVFLCVYVKSLWNFYRMKPTELLSESRKGEKELKRIGLWTAAGVILLMCGYYISVTSKLDSMILRIFFWRYFWWCSALIFCSPREVWLS